MPNGIQGQGNMMIAIMSGIVGACGGLLLSYFTLVADLKVVQNDVHNIKEQIKSQMDDRYRGADAKRDHALINERITQNAQHIAELEKLLRLEIERHNAEHRSD